MKYRKQKKKDSIQHLFNGAAARRRRHPLQPVQPILVLLYCILYFYCIFEMSKRKSNSSSPSSCPTCLIERVTPFSGSCAFVVRNAPTNHVCVQDMKNCRTELQMHKANFSASRYVYVSQYMRKLVSSSSTPLFPRRGRGQDTLLDSSPEKRLNLVLWIKRHEMFQLKLLEILREKKCQFSHVKKNKMFNKKVKMFTLNGTLEYFPQSSCTGADVIEV